MAAPAKPSAKAIGSFCLGLCSIFSILCVIHEDPFPGAGALALAGLLAIGLGVRAWRDIDKSSGRVSELQLARFGIVTGLCGFLLGGGMWLQSAIRVPRAAPWRVTRNQLRQLGLAMLQYHDTYKRLPPAAKCDPDGRPLYSWRVLLLPFLDEKPLYEEFHLEEPWDSAHNLQLASRMPSVYADMGSRAGTTFPLDTYVQVFVGPGAAFEGTRGMRIPDDFPDGTSKTILIAEASTAVPWSKPEDVPYSPGQPLPNLGGGFSDCFFAVMVDCSTNLISKSVSEETLRAAITRNGNDVLGPDWYK